MAAALAPGVSRKLKKVLETRTDSPDLLASLGALSTFYVQNTPQARRNLKSSIEQRSLAINRHFLDASLPAHKVCCYSPALPSIRRGGLFGNCFALSFACRRWITSKGRCTRSTTPGRSESISITAVMCSACLEMELTIRLVCVQIN